VLLPWELVSGLRQPRLREVAKNQEAALLNSERG